MMENREFPNKVTNYPYPDEGTKYMPLPDMPEVYLKAGAYALWMTKSSQWGEMFWSGAILTKMSDSGEMIDMGSAIDLDDIDNWEGTAWFNPDTNVYRPTSDEMSEIKDAIRAFTTFAGKW